MPKKGGTFYDAFVYTKLWTVFILVNELSAIVENTAHICGIFVVFILKHAIIFLAEVPKVMKAYKFLSALSH